MQWLWVLVALTTILEVTGGNAKTNKRGKGSSWWGIAKIGEPNNLSPLSTPQADLHMDTMVRKILRMKQRRLARENPGVLSAVVKGANQAIAECQFQFRHRRWNCSTTNFLRGKNLFGKIVDRGCRETAFIYAITSAGVTHAVARACAEGSIESCTCDYSHHAKGVQPAGARTNGGPAGVSDWVWGGCSDNIGFGFKFSREFVDTGEQGRNIREKMNLHNNEAGRAHVKTEMKQECKCHGMSGSCTMKTCWMRLQNFRVIGDRLKDRFDGASRVSVSNRLRPNENLPPAPGIGPNSHSINSLQAAGRVPARKRNKYNFQLKPHTREHKTPESWDLVYLDASPGFCEKNLKFGIQGTHGRQCNDTSIGVDGCDLMCCGRGYRTQEVLSVERCSCTFHWCCEVRCKVCKYLKTVHTCL